MPDHLDERWGSDVYRYVDWRPIGGTGFADVLNRLDIELRRPAGLKRCLHSELSHERLFCEQDDSAAF